MSTTTITGRTAVLAANLTDAAVLPVDDVSANTRKATVAQMRTQIYSAATNAFPNSTAFVVGVDPTGSEPTRLAGAARISGSVVLPLATGKQIDNSSATTANILNAGTLAVAASDFCDITLSEILVNGQTADFCVTNTAISIRFQTGTIYTVTAGTGSKINVTYAAGAITIQNLSGSTVAFRISSRTRA